MKAQRCQPIWVRIRESLTGECVQCFHPSLARRLGLLLPCGTSGLPSPPGSPLHPKREGQARRRRKPGRAPRGLGVCGEGFWRAVWSSCEGRWDRAEGTWRGPGDLGCTPRGWARGLCGDGRRLALPTLRRPVAPDPLPAASFPCVAPAPPAPPPARSRPVAPFPGSELGRAAALSRASTPCPARPLAGCRGRAAAATAPGPGTDFSCPVRSGCARPPH